MYIALLILIAGIGAGRLLSQHLSGAMLSRLTMASIFLLLFLLGAAIGGNHNLLERLPQLGLDALLLALCCLAGSIFASVLATPMLTRRSKKR